MKLCRIILGVIILLLLIGSWADAADKKEQISNAWAQRKLNPILPFLKDESPDIRKEAVNKLGWFDSTKAVQALTPMLKDKNPQVRREAAKSLRKIGGERIIGPLLSALNDDTVFVRRSVVEALSRKKDTRVVEPLIPMLKDNDHKVRAKAAEILGYNADIRALEPCLAALKDDHYTVRAEAAAALGAIGSTKAVRPLCHALKDKGYNVAEAAALALGKIGDARAVEPLLSALTHPNHQVRQKATIALGQIGRTEVENKISGWCKHTVDGQTKAAKPIVYLLAVGSYEIAGYYAYSATNSPTPDLIPWGKKIGPKSDNSVQLLEMESKETVCKAKPTVVIIAEQFSQISKTQWNVRNKSWKTFIKFHCLPLNKSANMNLNWCGRTYSGYTKPAGGSSSVNAYRHKSPWEKVPPLKILQQ